MIDITIDRVDAEPAVFDASKFLRVFRGTQTSPRTNPIPSATTVTIDDPQALIHTNDTIASVLQKLNGQVNLAHFIGGDGTGVWVNADRVKNIRAVIRNDVEPPAFPEIEPPIEANTIFSLGKFTQLVRNLPTDVQMEIERVKSRLN
jgi:hypothetical protein